MKNKKLIIMALSFVLIFSATFFVAYAYLFDNGTLVNKLEVANNTIDIEEEYEPPEEIHEGDNVFKKEVQIKNTGNVSCYVRVFFDFSDSKIKDKAFITNEDFIKTPDNSKSLTWYKANEYNNHLPEGWVYVSLTENKTLGGYYYYTKPLAVGESTEYLFKAINAHFDREQDVTDFEIIISAESVQTLDKNGQEASSWQAIWEEFMTRR